MQERDEVGDPINVIVVRFQRSIESGAEPKIEEYLRDYGDVSRVGLLEKLMHIELQHRAASSSIDRSVIATEYSLRFPEDATVVEVAVKRFFDGPSEPQEKESPTLDSHTLDSRTLDSHTLDSRTLDSQTVDSEGTAIGDQDSNGSSEKACLPEKLGRYRIEKELGRGAFGRVLLGTDEELKRRVALKVPHRRRISSASDLDAYIAEARLLAELDHPHVVPVYDVGRTDDGLCYVVSKFIDGQNLESMLQTQRLSLEQGVGMVIQIASALDYANTHKQRLVHRDVKPANILISQDQTAYLADFGLAIKEEDFGRGPKFVGTIKYMSPEQARGEGHRVDAQSDVYSLGVVFYEILTGELPHRSKTQSEVLEEIQNSEVAPPRQRDRSVPSELNRICLKALARRKIERYATAGDFAADLDFYLQNAPSDSGFLGAAVATETPESSDSSISSAQKHGSDTSSFGGRSTRGSSKRKSTIGSLSQGLDLSATVVPKGLRAFDAADAEFFLSLLPGPRDRHGLPESIRFWKSRIEQEGTDQRLTVGLIYGPSGCGKSSFVKAGLLPWLDASVVPVAIEANADGTEATLKQAILDSTAGLSADLTLPEVVASIRKGRGIRAGSKLLLVIDQFEQWLSSNPEPRGTELYRALRQCDPDRIPCVLLLRDEFLMGIHRFMAELEVPIEENRNAAVVDLFDSLHARQTLLRFGHAHGRFSSDQEDELTEQEHRFLDRAITEMSEGNKVSPIQLAIFTEMFKGKRWTSTTLAKGWGRHGIAREFLEESFDHASTPIEYRYHQRAAQAVLRQLTTVRDTGSNLLKGGKYSRDELMLAAKYQDRPQDFETLLRILDADLRLITPVDAEPGKGGQTQHYQITHDHMVPVIREWIDAKQRETKEGRAKLKLEELTKLWTHAPEVRHLPSLTEFMNILWNTSREAKTADQTRLIRNAQMYYGMRFISIMGVFASIILIAVVIMNRTRDFQTIAELQTKRSTEIAEVLPAIEARGIVDRYHSRLLQDFSQNELSLQAKLNTGVALVRGSYLVLPPVANLLLDERVKRPEFAALSDLLEIPNLQTELLQRAVSEITSEEPLRQLKAAHWLSRLDSQRLTDRDVEHLARTLIHLAGFEGPREWMELFDGIHKRIEPALSAILHEEAAANSGIDKRERFAILALLTRIASEDHASSVQLVKHARTRTEFQEVIRAFQTLGEENADVWNKSLLELTTEVRARQTALREQQLLLSDVNRRRYDLDQERDEIDEKKRIPPEELERRQQISAQLKELNERIIDEKLAGRQLDDAIESSCSQLASLIVGMLGVELGGDLWNQFIPTKDPRLAAMLIQRACFLDNGLSLITQKLSLLSETEDQLRHSLLLAAGVCLRNRETISNATREALLSVAWQSFSSTSASVHAAGRYLLLQLGQAEQVAKQLDERRRIIRTNQDLDGATWWVNSCGQTMIVPPNQIDKFFIGSPLYERGRYDGDLDDSEYQHQRMIGRIIAVSMHEVTVRQYREFDPDYVPDRLVSPTDDCPATNVSWLQAAEYCSWLTEQEQLQDPVYSVNRRLEACNVLSKPFERSGYRLPSETEWEYCVRADTVTSRPFGETLSLADSYEHFNSDNAIAVGSLMPNWWGFSDMLGNVFEWAHGELWQYGPDPLKDLAKHELVSVHKGGWLTGTGGEPQRAYRGGGYSWGESNVRAAARDQSDVHLPIPQIGFRICRTLVVLDTEVARAVSP